MSRIPTPATIADAPAASQPLLEAVKKQLGSPRTSSGLSPTARQHSKVIWVFPGAR